MPPASTADRLLDAQVVWMVDQLTGEDLPRLIGEVVDDLTELGRKITVGEATDPTAVKEFLRTALQQVPASAAASTLVSVAAEAAYDGPAAPFTLAELVQREHVEQLLTEAFAHLDLAEVFLDQIAESPLVATLATRFVGRLVSEVVATNRAVAEKIPGVGSLVSLGSNMAGKVVGAADKQFEALLGDTAGKGATFAMRRLNKVAVETLRDPAAQQAALQVFDLYADTPLGSGGDRLGDREDVHRIADLTQEIAIGIAASAPASALVDALVDGFLAVYREETLTTLVADLGGDRDDLVARATALATPLVTAAVASGEVEQLLRARLAPFFHSPQVAAILG